jgi:hypothetical protein
LTTCRIVLLVVEADDDIAVSIAVSSEVSNVTAGALSSNGRECYCTVILARTQDEKFGYRR